MLVGLLEKKWANLWSLGCAGTGDPHEVADAQKGCQSGRGSGQEKQRKRAGASDACASEGFAIRKRNGDVDIIDIAKHYIDMAKACTTHTEYFRAPKVYHGISQRSWPNPRGTGFDPGIPWAWAGKLMGTARTGLQCFVFFVQEVPEGDEYLTDKLQTVRNTYNVYIYIFIIIYIYIYFNFAETSIYQT